MLQIALIAGVVERIIEYISGQFKLSRQMAVGTGMGLGVILSVIFNLDIFGAFGLEALGWRKYVAIALTGPIIGLGSELIHSIVRGAESVKDIVKGKANGNGKPSA